MLVLVGIRIHVESRRQMPSPCAAQEAMVPQVIVAVADEHVEDDPSIQLGEIRRDSLGIAIVLNGLGDVEVAASPSSRTSSVVADA